MAVGIPISPQQCIQWKMKLDLGVAAGRLREGKEPQNPYVVWRYDGGGFSIKCYSSRKGMTLHCDQERFFEILSAGRFEDLPVPDFERRRGGLHHPNGSLFPLHPASTTAAEPKKKSERLRLSEDQTECYSQVLAWYRDTASPLLTLGGFAGTGKTTIISRLARDLGKTARLAFCAYTGKAANVLTTKLKTAGINLERHPCTTIHRLIYEPVTNDDGEVVAWEKVKAIKADLVIVDEASMVGREIFEDLSSYPGVRILAVGDHGQLPPVDGGASMSLMNDPDLRLEVIHRQARGNPILEFGAYVRGGGVPEGYSETDDPRLKIMSEPGTLRPLLETVFKSIEAARSTVVLCWTNALRVEVNRLARSMVGIDAAWPAPGDALICLRNTKFGEVTIANGARGFVEASREDGPQHLRTKVRFDDEGWSLDGRLCKSQFSREGTYASFTEYADDTEQEVASWYDVGLLFDYAYALTVHKAQGSQFPHVIVVDEYPRKKSTASKTYSRWLYTAATRAIETLTIVKP